MSNFDFRSFNLNLLPALDALLAEASVSRAAARAGVSQSAMSHSLARLRELLDDPLLVNTGQRMEPTARAAELAGPLRAALEQLRAALETGARFDPRSAERELAIASFDYFEMIALPDLCAFLRERAPRITLRIERLTPAVARRLVAGELDMVFATIGTRMPATLTRRALFDESFAVIARSDHPIARGKLSLERYLELEHILVSVEGAAEGVVDRVLARLDRRRRVVARVPHFLSAPLVVAGSDAICTLPRSVALRARQLFGVRVLAPPLELPTTTVAAFWPPQLERDPAHAWFRDRLFSGQALSAPLRRRLKERQAQRPPV